MAILIPQLKTNRSISLRFSLRGYKAQSKVKPGKNNTAGRLRIIRSILSGIKAMIGMSNNVRILTIKRIYGLFIRTLNTPRSKGLRDIESNIL